ncbi:SDR family NAD(P)-dependent oxidoreductase [Bradyrhizobium sp. LA7.1]|uniref:SDR family NAD(P)-dependent oxidoreductase n=1 Tax=Bradyrhizobium sp. LA7.1 TaxID=3156324 RepID=UPI003399F16C
MNFVFSGGTSGIGRAVAVELARRGAAVLVLGRDAGRGERAVEMLLAAGACEARWEPADLHSVAGIAQAAQGILGWRSELHGLVHSAMTLNTRDMKRRESPDGLEAAFALQYLARAALNRALADALSASGDGRVVHVGANPPLRLVPDLDDLQFERRRWSLTGSLMSSQVLGFLHVQEAARRWRDSSVHLTISCVGPTMTDSIREQAWWARALYAVIATTPERAANNAVRFLLEDEAREMSGGAFLSPKKFRSTSIVYDDAMSGRVWLLTERILYAHGFDTSLLKR